MFHHLLQPRYLFAIFLLAGLYTARVAALPEGPDVRFGNARFDLQASGVLDITNSTKAIIDWQAFSTRRGDVVRFIQPGSSSSVLNRVTGQDPSSLLGQITSNGRVYLINPNGIVFGEGSVVDTRGFLASTLAISPRDFMRNDFLFVQQGQGQIKNQGLIQARADGNVILLAPQIENQGQILTESGRILLATGEKLTLSSLDDPEIRFEIQAASHQVINLGELRTGGAVEVFTGSLINRGSMEAQGVSRDQQGRIVLSAQHDLTLSADSRLTVTSPGGGPLRLESLDGTIRVGGSITVGDGKAGDNGSVKVTGHAIGLEDAVIASENWQLSTPQASLLSGATEAQARLLPLKLALSAEGELTQGRPLQVGQLTFQRQARVDLGDVDNRIGQLSGTVDRIRLNNRSDGVTAVFRVEGLQAKSDIDIDNRGAMAVQGPVISREAGVTLQTRSPLTLAGTLAARDDLTVAAGDGTAFDDRLRFEPGTSLSSSRGNIDLVFRGELEGTQPALKAPHGLIRFNGQTSEPSTDPVPPLDTSNPQTVRVVQEAGFTQNSQVVVLTQQASSAPTGEDENDPRSERTLRTLPAPENTSGITRSRAIPVCR